MAAHCCESRASAGAGTRSAPECHLCTCPRHYPMLGPRSGVPGRGAPTVRSGEADRNRSEGFPRRLRTRRLGKKVLANGFGSVENAGLLGRPPNSPVALATVVAVRSNRSVPRAASPPRGIMRKQLANRDGKWPAKRPPRVWPRGFADIWVMRPPAGPGRHLESRERETQLDPMRRGLREIGARPDLVGVFPVPMS